MFRALQIGLYRPISLAVDPNAFFEEGMIAQYKVIGNDVVVGVSDGTAPLGIFDDVKTTVYSRPSIDEEVIVVAPVVDFDGYKFRMGVDTLAELQNGPVVPNSFRSDVPGIQVSTRGVVRARAGMELNYTTVGSPTPNAIRVVCNYYYDIPGIPGVDSTLGSGRATVWMVPGGIFETDQFELVPYPLNATLFVSAAGKLTTEKTMENQPGVGIVSCPPSAHNAVLQFVWKG
jgi:hypothetical protein